MKLKTLLETAMRSKIYTVFMLTLLTVSGPVQSAITWKNPATVDDDGPTALTNSFKKNLSEIVLNGLEDDLLFHEGSVNKLEDIQFVKKDGRNALNIFMTYEDTGPDFDWKRLGTDGFAQRTQFLFARNRFIQKNDEKWYRLSYWLEGDNHTPNKGATIGLHQLSIFDLKLKSDRDTDLGVGFNYSSRDNEVGFDFIQDGEGTRDTHGGKSYLDFPRLEFRLNEKDFGHDFNNRWVDIVVNIKWSEDGHTRIWVDGKLVANMLYGPHGGRETRQYGFKFGPYRNYMPYGLRAPDINIYYADVGVSDSCEEILGNCKKLKSQITEGEYLARVKEPKVCFQSNCTAYMQKTTLQGGKLPFPERFIGRGIWENNIQTFVSTNDVTRGIISASTMIKHRSPVRNVVFSFKANRARKTGQVSFISGVTNDGLLESSGQFVDYFHSKADAELVFEQCGVNMLEFQGAYYPIFELQEALDISFERFGHNLEIFSEKSNCLINTLDVQHPEYWYELLHLAGKSLRGSFQKGNIGENAEIVEQFAQFQKEFRGWR